MNNAIEWTDRAVVKKKRKLDSKICENKIN